MQCDTKSQIPTSFSRCGTTSQNNRLTMCIVWMHTLTNTPCSRIRNVFCTAETNYVEFNQRISPWFTCSAWDVSWREYEKAIHLHKRKQYVSSKTKDGVNLENNNINDNPLMSLTMAWHWLRYQEVVLKTWQQKKTFAEFRTAYHIFLWQG